MIKYIVYPGRVVSKIDGDEHFICGRELIRLYGVDPKECVIAKSLSDLAGRRRKLIELRPDYSGRYQLERVES